jgi:hypothetical protein
VENATVFRMNIFDIFFLNLLHLLHFVFQLFWPS